MIFTADKLDEEAGQVAAEAKAALAAGDTRRAAALFGDAGEIIEAKVANLRRLNTITAGPIDGPRS
jgi:Cdc6-like AAA superfamily ATPase